MQLKMQYNFAALWKMANTVYYGKMRQKIQKCSELRLNIKQENTYYTVKKYHLAWYMKKVGLMLMKKRDNPD